jgi:hypothetical protein
MQGRPFLQKGPPLHPSTKTPKLWYVSCLEAPNCGVNGRDAQVATDRLNACETVPDLRDFAG